MQVYGNVNKFSDKLGSSIKQLEEEVFFRFVDGLADMTKNNKVMFGSSRCIVLHDRIKDPETGKLVEVGIPADDGLSPDGTRIIRWKKFYVAPEGENNLINGNFTLVPGKQTHEELYWFLQLWNENASNDNRLSHAVKKVQQINVGQETLDKASEVDALEKALSAVRLMDEEDVKEFAAIMNWDMKQGVNVLKAKAKLYAKEAPDDFLKKTGAGDSDLKNTEKIKRALDKNIISYQPGEGGNGKMVWTHNGSTIAKLEKDTGENEVQQMAHWIKVSGNGKTIMASIVKQLTA